MQVPEESHLFVFLLVIPDDLGGGHTHLHAVNDKLPCSLQGFTRKVLIGRQEGRQRSHTMMPKGSFKPQVHDSLALHRQFFCLFHICCLHCLIVDLQPNYMWCYVSLSFNKKEREATVCLCVDLQKHYYSCQSGSAVTNTEMFHLPLQEVT